MKLKALKFTKKITHFTEISVFHGRRPISRKMPRPWNRELGWSLRMRPMRYWHWPHNVEQGLWYATMSVCLSAPAWALSSKPAAVGLLSLARQAGDIDRLLHGRRSEAAAAACECGQCHVVNVHSKPNTDFLYIGWQWRNFVPYLCRLVFAAILWVKLL